MLPQKHQDQDSNKLSLMCFCLEGLELLGALHFSASEKSQFSDFIYNNYYITHGFRALTASSGGYDQANISSTFFGIQSLLILKDPINHKLDRHQIMRFVKLCQYTDGPNKGAFSPTLNVDNSHFGDSDLRICYMAAGIRTMLKYEGEEDFDTESLIKYVLNRRNLDGGFSCTKSSESHLGYTYCAIATLKLLGYRDLVVDKTINWIVHRQVNYPELIYPPDVDHQDYGGFNGRENKASDSCYSWWSLGTLKLLDRLKLVDLQANTQFLLQNQDHRVGGIAKYFDANSDPYHTYLALCSLALAKDETEFGYSNELGDIDAELTIPVILRQYLDSLEW